MWTCFLTSAKFLLAVGKYKEAVDSLQTTAMICRERGAMKNSKLAQTLSLAGEAWFNLSQFDLSIQSCTEAITISQKPPEESLDVLETLAKSYAGKSAFEQAIGFYEQILSIKRATFPARHLEIADTILNMGIALEGKGNFALAIDLFQEALSIYEKQIPSRDTTIRIANANKNVSCVYLQEGQYAKAVELLERVFQIEMQIGRNDIGVVNTLNKSWRRLHSFGTICQGNIPVQNGIIVH